jgi:UrcA family protein
MKTQSQIKQIAMSSVAAMCFAGAAMVAHADNALESAPQHTVHYADLNLSTSVGASTLYRRIRAAAAQVCGDVYSRRFEEAREAQACVAHAVQVSVRSVNNAMLTNEYNSRIGAAQKSIDVASIR